MWLCAENVRDISNKNTEAVSVFFADALCHYELISYLVECGGRH